MGHPASENLIFLGYRRRCRLEGIVARPTSPQRMVLRANIVLLAAGRRPDEQIAAELGCHVHTVRKWRHRFAAGGMPGLADRPRCGRPEVHGPSTRLAVVATATSTPPDGESSWSHTMIAGHLGGNGLAISAATVGRILGEARVRPHKVRGWLNRADDDRFWAAAGAVCDLYLHLPDGTALISLDEKTGIQAKSRRHPGQPMRRGRDARREFEYVRHGTVSIIGAMNVATGEVIAERITRNDSAACIRFLRLLDQSIPPQLNIHLIMDNGSSHTSKLTRAWVTAHPRFQVTFTPKHGSWLNMIEQWFGVLTRRLLRRGEFTSRDDLENKITAFTVRYNKTARPYTWTYDADADHARYLERRKPAAATTRPAIPQAA
jgi:transposase